MNYFKKGEHSFRENDDYIMYDEETIGFDVIIVKYKRTDKETLVFDCFNNGDRVAFTEKSFAEHDELKNVVFPYDVKVFIDSGAFENCKGLEKVSIAEADFVFYTSSLYGCDNLKELTLPQGTKINEDWTLPADCKVIYTTKIDNDEELDLTGQDRGRS